MTVAIDRPRAKTRRSARSTNFELYSWVFMRVSGLLLVFLVLGHLFVMHIADGGVERVNFCLLYTSPSPRDS